MSSAHVNCASCGVAFTSFSSETSKAFLCDDCKGLNDSDYQSNSIKSDSEEKISKTGNSDLADIFSNLNPVLFFITIVLISLLFFVLNLSGFGFMISLVISLVLLLSAILLHGAAALIIEIMSMTREINKKLDK